MSDVQVDRRGPVATLTLNRPDRRNALDPSLLRALADGVAVVSDAEDVRVVVLTGAGSAFSAGADLEWMRATRELSDERNHEDAEGMAAAFDAVDRCPKAVIARVNGAAIGGGAGLVACADVAVAVDSARFAFAEVRLGLLPATIAPFVLRSIGPGRARELFTTGRRFDASEAATFGLVHHVVSAEELDATTDDVVQSFLACGPRAVAANKRLVRDITESLDVAGLPDRIADARAGDEAQEGVTAFLEKRPPEMVRLRRLLIANRGEIAVRIIHACREMGISTVVAVAGAERDGLPAGLADTTVEVESYMDAAAIVRGASDAGADAVHPGYGFLSEDAAFAEQVVAAGLQWVGPPPNAMRRLGDKVQARAVAISAGVPVVPAIEVEGLSEAAIDEEASRLGTPLLVKAAAGGGGRGMRTVEDLSGLHEALDAARREAGASFGDGRVFLERRLHHVHHVEVQILLDGLGNAVHLGERDCSLQRRHQKIVEESPSPAVDAPMRATLGDASIAIARAAGYRGAGTVEFLVGDDGGWWFLEVNARLQVEHPVTEAVAGIDLVRAQLSIAGGDPLEIDQEHVSIRGHAIEARVYAEDPSDGFLPAQGRIEHLDLPGWPGVRIDTALRTGDVVGLGFDPLLAKVIAWAEDRPSALARLRAVLADVHIVGVATNLGFLLDALDHDEVRGGRADTDWVESVWSPQVPDLPGGTYAMRDPRDPWVAFGAADRDTGGDVVIAGSHAQFRGWAYRLADDDLVATDRATPEGSLTAPMPASVLRIEVAAGDTVKPGQLVAVLEAMKIQVQITAPVAGTVRAVRAQVGDVVAKGETLIELEES